MNVEETIKQLILLPRKHGELGTSAYSLLEDSGYFENHAEITKHLLQEALLRSPEHLAEWVQFSEDKRSSGWYLMRQSNGTFEVGYNPAKGESKSISAKQFSDKVTACAAFIKLEIEDMRGINIGSRTNRKTRERS